MSADVSRSCAQCDGTGIDYSRANEAVPDPKTGEPVQRGPEPCDACRGTGEVITECPHEFGALGAISGDYCIHCGAKLSALKGSYPLLAQLEVGETSAEQDERCPHRAMVAGVLGVRCGKSIHEGSQHGVTLEGSGDFVEGSIEWTDERG